MFSTLKKILGTHRTRQASRERPRLNADHWPSLIYGVGDVHGCLAELRHLEHMIIEDAGPDTGEKWIVYLGDYIDRGPSSAGVLDHLISRAPQGFRRICLAGNHETMMLDFIDNPRPDSGWLEFGGIETLASYGIPPSTIQNMRGRDGQDILRSHIPTEHLTFLAELALTLSLPGVVFVHAGLRPGVPLKDQRERDLLWIRDEFIDASPEPDRLVVHGHTPASQAVVMPGRICVDTGAFATGKLTAVRLSQGKDPRLISTLA